MTMEMRHALRRGLMFGGVVLLVILGVSLPPAAPVAAATLTVTDCGDAGANTLRGKIGSAAAGDAIVFAQDCTITLATGTLTLAQNVTIDGSGHTVVVDGGCTFSGGICTSGGVRVFQVNSGVTATLNGLTIQHGFDAASDGGGIFNAGTLTVTNSTLSGNRGASHGGGIVNGGGTLAVTNCTFSGNNAGSAGGGIYESNLAGLLTVTNSTFSGNSAVNNGGGIFNAGSTVILTNTLVAGNTVGDVFGGFTGTNNLIGGTPLLGAFGTYGGPTATFPLLPGSPAINAGAAVGSGPSGNTVPATDQRGVARVGTPDIGAFESQGFTLAVSGGNPQTTLAHTPFPTPLAVTVSSSHSEPVNGGQVTFTAPGSGASATVGGNPATIASGAASVTAQANGTAGAYTVSASMAGATSVTFNLTNVVAAPVVTSVGDGAANGLHCVGTNTTCTLRDAIAAVNAGGASGTTITFDATVFPAGTAKTITLSVAAGGTLTLGASITIDGSGHTVVVDGNNAMTVFSVNGGVTASLANVTIQHGFNAAGNGGGIANGGTLTVTNSTLTNNTASDPGGLGGGIFNQVGTVTVTNSTLSANSATSGGGIYILGGTVTVTNSTLANNSAPAGGGAIVGSNAPATLTVTNSTLSANPSGGGGQIRQALALTVTLTNTIVALPQGFDTDLQGAIAGNTNLIDDASAITGTGNRTKTPAHLGPLGNYGGPTQTFGVLTGSPAIGNGDPTVCASTTTPAGAAVAGKDQRGAPRPASHCDIGAVEGQPTTLAVSGAATTAAGADYLATVSALNEFGGVLPWYRGTVHLTTTDPNASPAPLTHLYGAGDGGAYTFLLARTLLTAGTDTLTATDNSPSPLSGSKMVAVGGPAIFKTNEQTEGVLPLSGPVVGGTTITITGAGFTGASVAVGGVACTNVQVTPNGASQSLTCVTGAHAAGTVDVVVTTGSGSATAVGGYTYGVPGGPPPASRPGPSVPGVVSPAPVGKGGPTQPGVVNPVPVGRP